MEKKCTKCKEVKSLDEFNNNKRIKSGKAYQCKSCYKEHTKRHYKKNSEEIKQKARDWYKNNKEKRKKYIEENKETIKKNRKEYTAKNKEYIKKRQQKYREKNKESIKIWTALYHQENKEKILLWNKKYSNKNKRNERAREKWKTNPLFNLKNRIRGLIHISLKNKGYDKKTKTYNMLKCDYNFFMQWLNGIASNSYTFGLKDLHLDHVVPVSLAQTEDELLLLNHYSNFQLLSADENLVKSNRYVNPLNLARVLEHHPNPDKIREIHARL
jgi:hypothetical protein